MKKIKTIASKIGFSLIAVLFGVSFTAAGIGAGAIPLAKQIIGLWKAQNLVAVQAQIEKLSLEEHDGETRTYQVKAEFSYSYQALGHRSKRINIGGDSNDNIGDYQRDIYRELQRAKDQEQSVTLWVDPDDPEFAVYDRAIRWMRLLFLLPFASLFPAVGIGACWALWKIWRPSAEPVIPVVTVEFAQQHQVPLSSLIIAPEQSGALPMGVFAVFWNLLSWPIAGVALFSSHIGNNPLILIAAIFPLVGIGMILFAVKLWFVRSCIGQPVLVTTRAPEIGLNEWKASIRFIPPLGESLGMLRTPQASYPVRIECQCLYEDSSGEDTSTKTLWSLVVDEVQLAHGTSQTSFMVDFPAQLPASGAADGKNKKIIWKLVVRVFDGDLVFPLLVGFALNESSKIHWQCLLHKSKPLDQLDLTKLAEAASLRNAADRMNPWLGRIFLLFFVAVAGWSLINFLLSVFGPARDEAHSEMAPVQTETYTQLQAKLAEGADPNRRDNDGLTSLMQAAQEKDLAKVQLLLSSGARVDNVTPVVISAAGYRMGNRSALFDAISSDAVEVVGVLLDAGADMRLASNQVWTPMHYAAYVGAVRSMRVLREYGAEIDVPFSEARGSTPLMVAAQYDQLQSIQFLLESGADKTKLDLYGENACGYARYFKKTAAAKALDCD
ncbi:ankyrin repeat domain-containing protein [Undibacterium sp. RTI2.1]|uniref:ankyrin repeat domain-containing protein n=1 Tax=unclassified Undibacterium TaxID=2630295 RepID=UPI002B23D90F|nr:MULTISPECIES: ankyrin repeat domain-containing protein [unclassified Undibacterium]MEB0030540.1 ankyrin repeat domain-containing protein [Undibacterium sp. RTI2.1]MEB0116959.1 ankyrin repeat domain-containing protein [Undibacterium sp. RTI2.2]